MRRKIWFCLISILCLILEAAVGKQSMYSVTISEGNWRIAKITAQIELVDNLLCMNNFGAEQFSDGYAHFIQNLRAIDSSGNPVPLEYLGNARWKVSVPLKHPLTLYYEVVLNHDKFRWHHGPDEAPYIKDDCVFWTGRALFIVNNGMENIIARFNLPDGWRISTPWRPVEGQAFVFSAENQTDLTESFILAGVHSSDLLKFEETEILLAVGGRIKESKMILAETVEELLMQYMKLFGGAPEERMLIIVNPYDRKNSTDGGVFGKSISILTGDEPSKNTLGTFTAHEIFHIYNGRAIRPVQQEYWFSEGFTDYYANVISGRLGFLSEHDFLQKLKETCKEYLTKSGFVSMRRAGDNIVKNKRFIYAGGYLVAMILDVQIRRLANNEKSLDDLMRWMYQEFHVSGRLYTMEDIVRIANRLLNHDLSEFFVKYVEGTDKLPISEYLSYCGIEVKWEMEEVLPSMDYVIRRLLRIDSIHETPDGLMIHRSEKAGYRDGDYLTSISGRSVRSFKDMQRAFINLKPGDKVNLTLIREGKEITIDITLGSEAGEMPMERSVEISVGKKTHMNPIEQAILSGILKSIKKN